ncbi:sigma-54-dependent Fis family transcriptional regulator [Halalkalibacterium ligniniphilum]|uniref:sigma-54-dependent Fis family transcriptional regulator n=1 Tax=Halalkalibacterium ligniniphilum TaxID=1134413 RepID=UPI000346EE1E|nr:sigma-54-dependent Fis family transcriptional regulator [Halalkalibacterium ligniniphilum]
MNNRIKPFQPYTNHKLERNRLEEIWEHFIIQKKIPEHLSLRPEMVQSWQRCLRKGVDPVATRAPIISSNQQASEEFVNSRLYRHLLPYLRDIKDKVVEMNNLLVITNSKGEINHIDGAFSLQGKAEKMNFVVGSSWAENDSGTNAIGTVLATKSPIQVFAAEHFCQEVHEWTCSAAPILDPLTDEVLGVIDLTGLWKGAHPYTLSVVLTIARAIEGEIRQELEMDRYKMLANYFEATMRTPTIPLAALDMGGIVIKADPLLYENKLIDENHQLMGLPPKILQRTSEESWEVETTKGRWKFVTVPYADQGRPIGLIVHAVPPKYEGIKVNASTIKHSFSSMIGQSKIFTSTIKEALSAAGTDLPILIEGESGTGKELFAQSIHNASKRADGPFVAVNCGALPKELGVSELFGFEGGTFTGAAKGGKAGKFKQAQGGTIFLDEIGEMPLEMQTFLLRVLEEGEVVPVGAQKPIPLNVRVVAATNRDLLTAVENGQFRRDLFYRLNILCIHIPSLRNRMEDIPLLIDYHLKKACREIGRSPLQVNESVLRILQEYRWPGNVRELRNIAYRLATNTSGDFIDICDLPVEISKNRINQREHIQTNEESFNDDKKIESRGMLKQNEEFKETSIKDKELQFILTTLEKVNGNVAEAARRLGIHRSTIYRKLKAVSSYKKR